MSPNSSGSGAALQAVARHFGRRFVQAMAQSGADDLQHWLAAPSFCLATRLALRRDDGTTEILPAWRLRYAPPLGPCKGGVRFQEQVDEASLTTLAARILVKCAANGLPHGGAAGGVRVDPRRLSAAELRRVAEAYVDAYHPVIGEDRDILSPDLGTGAKVMGWMAMRVHALRGHYEPGAINGKPLALGGARGRPGATAAGARMVLDRLLARRGMGLKGMRVAVQGFGAAGGSLAVELAQAGAVLVAATDSVGGWHRPDGLDAAALFSAKQSGRALPSIAVAGGTPIAPEAALEAPAELVVSAAAGGQVTRENAPRLQCRFVVEIANAAVTDEAEEILAARGVEVVPDIIVNAGGITVSHFEWVQNRTGRSLTAEEVHAGLRSRMQDVADRWLSEAEARRVPLTVAAQFLAIDRIREALEP